MAVAVVEVEVVGGAALRGEVVAVTAVVVAAVAVKSTLVWT